MVRSGDGWFGLRLGFFDAVDLALGAEAEKIVFGIDDDRIAWSEATAQ